MDYQDFTDVEFLSSLMDGTAFGDTQNLAPDMQDVSAMDPLENDAPTPAAPEGDLVSPPAAAGGQEAPVVEAPQVTEPAAAPAASAPAPSGADALFNSPKSDDSRADSVLGA